MSNDQPLLSVLIVNFHSSRLLEESLVALEASTIANRLEIIVVDNASPEFELDRMTVAHPSVVFLPQQWNTTYTGGNNLAFARSTAELVLMQNPDTRVEPEALERAVGHMRGEADLSALSAYLIGPDGRLQRYYRQLPTLKDLPILLFEPLFRNTPRGRRFLMLEESFEGTTPVSDPPGAFILSRRSALGGYLLEPGYYNFLSDLELCERLGRIGRVAVFEDVRCHHVRAGAGVGTTDPVARLRLYQDFTWGLRRYFTPRLGLSGRAFLNALLVAYWLTRIALMAFRHPRHLFRGIPTAVGAIAGRPPTY